MLCWTEYKRFWCFSVCNELFTCSSLHRWRWFTGYYVQRFCMSVKKMPKDQRDREQREQESGITGHSRSSNSSVTLRKSWWRAGLGAEQWLGRWQSHKQRGRLLLYWGKQNFHVLFKYAGLQQKYLTLPSVSSISCFSQSITFSYPKHNHTPV